MKIVNIQIQFVSLVQLVDVQDLKTRQIKDIIFRDWVKPRSLC